MKGQVATLREQMVSAQAQAEESANEGEQMTMPSFMVGRRFRMPS